MAYTDSGLGWYANSDWVQNSAVTIADSGPGTHGSGLFVPAYPGYLSLGQIDLTFPGNDAQYSIYDNTQPGYYVVLKDHEGGVPYYGFVVSTEFFRGRVTYFPNGFTSYGAAYLDNVTGKWFQGGHAGDWDYNLLAQTVPVYDTAQDAVDAIFANVLFAKSGNGYAVACVVKWREELGGDVYISPVLISTVNTATFWTVNGNTPIQALTEHTFGGTNFFMRYSKAFKAEDYPQFSSNVPLLDYSDSAPVTDSLMFALIAAASELGIGTPPQDDPYAGGGESEPGGDGDGDFDFSSTDIPIPGLPSIGAMDAGFVQLYKMSAAELKSLAAYMWSGSFDPDNFRRLFADPMDAILGCSIIPTDGVHPSAAYAEIKIGNVGTGVLAPKCSEQYFEVDCGTIQMPAKWGAYLDYSPYSKLSLYLPYIGMVPISPDDCMGGSISVKYHIDILSGSCCVYVYCYSNRGADGHLLYVFNGSCACVVPVTSGQYTNAVFGILGAVGGIVNSALSVVGGGQQGSGPKAGLSGVGGLIGGVEQSFQSIQSMIKPEIQRSGNIGASAGLMGPQYPFLVLNIPHMAIPGQQNVYQGYPSFVTKRIGELSGYTEMQVSHLNGMTCTQTEAEEIISLLSQGVIL